MAGAMSEGGGNATSDGDSSIPIPSIRDITSVDIDELDGDSIDQLQMVLRRLQKRCDDDDDERHGDVTDRHMTSPGEQSPQHASCELLTTMVELYK